MTHKSGGVGGAKCVWPICTPICVVIQPPCASSRVRGGGAKYYIGSGGRRLYGKNLNLKYIEEYDRFYTNTCFKRKRTRNGCVIND
jgi:hypothetical protein